jgi:hypothetical protein
MFDEHILISVFSWPTAVIVLGMVFMVLFREVIGLFLGRLGRVRVGPFEAYRQQPETETFAEHFAETLTEEDQPISDEELDEIEQMITHLAQTNTHHATELAKQREAVSYLRERADFFELQYLSLYLVQNSRAALLWFYSQPERASTREYFFTQFDPPTAVPDLAREKEIIFNVLLVQGLLDQQGAVLRLAEKGVRLLRHIKLIDP